MLITRSFVKLSELLSVFSTEESELIYEIICNEYCFGTTSSSLVIFGHVLYVIQNASSLDTNKINTIICELTKSFETHLIEFNTLLQNNTSGLNIDNMLYIELES